MSIADENTKHSKYTKVQTSVIKVCHDPFKAAHEGDYQLLEKLLEWPGDDIQPKVYAS